MTLDEAFALLAASPDHRVLRRINMATGPRDGVMPPAAVASTGHGGGEKPMITKCDRCGATYDDSDQTTNCPHELIMPAAHLAQKKAALELIGKDVCFAHQPDGPVHRIQTVYWNGMITLHDMAGEFAPHLFVIARSA